ncbi:hypothetical protein HPB49_020521 [Dermacentor silvarum]|uniref:Uncharacterized protein n=1 Tax=Dermacentor silvarum TaxID=543639 RepID=A0ACB8CMJ4_DERSI|nr:acetylcholinesterase isoform X2 [Dermacentor silvarum]KAH7946117.1 hypothetical protein HPB49_020521 [Dermacentor silvarum]
MRVEPRRRVMELKAASFSVLALFIVFSANAAAEDAPVIRTTTGNVVGQRLRAHARDVDAYLGIPYGQPPVGERRFLKPLPVSSWSGVFRADTMNPGCVQTDFVVTENAKIDMSNSVEDCLKLNLWVPRRDCDGSSDNGTVAPTCKSSLPVFVFIYGGLFSWGSSSLFMFDGLEFAARADVIFVSFNYRLGPLGFLNASVPGAEGNAGLYDQVEALRWVQNNARAFGGDPGAVTLAGQSAGAVSVSYHVISELSRGLFQRAVLLSGTPSTLAYAENINQHENFQAISTAVNCTNFYLTGRERIDAALSCLRKADAQRLVHDVERSMVYRYITILPGYGDSFLPHSPIDLEKARMNVKDIFLGTTQDDGAVLVAAMYSKMKWLKGSIDGHTILRVFLRHFFHVSLSKSLQFENAYFGRSQQISEVEVLRALSSVVTDLCFNCATDLFAQAALKNNVSVFRYVFSHRPSYSFWGDWVTVTHNDDLPFFLGTVRVDKKTLLEKHNDSFGELMREKYSVTTEELSFSDELIKALAEFSWTGKPKIPKSDMEWPKYTKENKAYVILKPNDYSVAYGPRSKKCHLWEPYLVKRQQSPTTPAPKHKPTPKRIPEKRPGKPLRPLDNFVESSASTGPLSSATALASMLFAIALNRS